jgi:tRNA(fMet)-specific endonuclease VapC
MRMLDTNICIELIRGRSELVLTRLRRHRVGTVGLSTITLAELRYGVSRSSDPGRNLLALAHFCAPLEILSFDDHAAAAYGAIRAALQIAGTPIGPLEMLIAAHALSLRALLVTNNEREFRRVPGLRVENWVKNH